MWLVCGKCRSTNGLFRLFEEDTYQCQNCHMLSSRKDLEAATEKRIFQPVREGKRIRIPTPNGHFYYDADGMKAEGKE